MNTNVLRKSLAVAVILLFIGVAVAPSINFTVVKASTDNDLIEVTTQACGIQGFGNTTVKLTREQYQNLEQYLVEFRARLNQTTTREEAVPIFKEAVVELNKYGLLPKGMSVENANRFLTMINQEYGKFEKLNIFSKFSQASSGVNNIFCFVVLHITTGWISEWGLLELSVMSLIALLAILSVWVSYNPGNFPGVTFLMSLLMRMISSPFAGLLVNLSWIYNAYSPLKFWMILIGYINEFWSIGLKGYRHSNSGADSVIGFKGFRIILPTETYYIGHALAISS
jgi:hypothetical protein